MRILVVEDEPRLLRSLAKALRRWLRSGYRRDGRRRLVKAQSYDYDAVVLDVMLLD